MMKRYLKGSLRPSHRDTHAIGGNHLYAKGFSLIETGLSMTIAALVVLGTMTLALNGAQSQFTASQVSSMTTTAADIQASLLRDAALANAVTITGNQLRFTGPFINEIIYELTPTFNLTRTQDGVTQQFNAPTQQIQCLTGQTCFARGDLISGTQTVGQVATVQNLQITTRDNGVTALETTMNRRATYTIPATTVNIAGQDKFL